MTQRRAAWSLTLLVLASLAGTARAEPVRMPFVMERPFLESLLRERVFVGEGNRLRAGDDGTGCQILELSRPRIRIRDGRILMRTDTLLQLGRTVAGRCLRLLGWRGQLEFEQRPVVGADGRSIELRMATWRALRTDGTPDTLSDTVGHWLDQFLPVAVKRVRVGLEAPLSDLEALLRLFVGERHAVRVDTLRAKISIVAVEVMDNRVGVTLGLPAPSSVAEPPAEPVEPRLSRAELARIQARLEDVDAFVTYTVQHLTDDAGSPQQVDVLLDALLEMRIALVEILGDPSRRPGDPVRELFVETWDGLGGTLRALGERQTNHASALRFLTFVAGADLLRALDGLGPTVGIDVSRQGLRRLARILTPNDDGDPLAPPDEVDPALRRAFGFGAPLPAPQRDDEQSWLDWLIKPAHAAEGLDRALVHRLNRWVPSKEDMDDYLPRVRQVLDHVAREQLRNKELEPAYHDLFRILIYATAWQESCWRQFVEEKNKRVPLLSGTGDVGMMQVNARIWRGFYEVHGLKWDIVYNARAGADILQNLLVRYAIRNREHEKTGRLDSLARSAYAAYNGGPRQYDRYRRSTPSAKGSKVDGLFYEKYRAIRSHGERAVKSCYD